MEKGENRKQTDSYRQSKADNQTYRPLDRQTDT